MRSKLLSGALLLAAAATSANAAIIDDFESYGVGTFPSPDWSVPAGDGGSLGSPGGQTIDVQSNGSNISGKHLQFATTYQADTVTRLLPSALSNDGEYIQVAVNIASGRTLASMFLTSGLYAGGTGQAAPQPPAALGVSSEPGATVFTTQHNGVFDGSMQIPGATPAAGTWYYLRAVLRDAGGTPGLLDSYDFQVLDSSMALLTQQTGIAFVGGEGPITGVALRSYEQTGTSNALALFDQLSVGVVPEPGTLSLAAIAAGALVSRRRTR